MGTLASRVTMLVFVVFLLYRDPRTAAIIRQLTPKRLYKKELNQLLIADGFNNIKDVIGVDAKENN